MHLFRTCPTHSSVGKSLAQDSLSFFQLGFYFLRQRNGDKQARMLWNIC